MISDEMRAAGAAAIEEFSIEGFVAWDEVAARVWIAMSQAHAGEEVTGAPFFLSLYRTNLRKLRKALAQPTGAQSNAT